MKKIDILFFAPFPPPFSGPEISANLFMNSGITDHFQIVTCNANFRKSNERKGHFGFEMIFGFFKIFYHFIRSIIKYQPSIVYFYPTATIFGWIFRDIWVVLFSKIFGLKIFVHHRAGHFGAAINKSKYLTKLIIKPTLLAADKHIFQSRTLSKQLNGILSNNKVEVIHNMIDTKLYNNEDPKNYDENFILFIGHLSQAKGYCDILSIIPDIVNKFPNIKFYFAGSKVNNEKNIKYNLYDKTSIKFIDPDYAYKKYIKGIYENNYKYLGVINEKEKIKLLKKANIFILPSYSEGFSMSLLEALSMSKPIITTKVGASTDIIRTNINGILIEPGDPQSLKKSILLLLRDESLRNKIALSNNSYRNNFSISHIKNNYIKLFDM